MVQRLQHVLVVAQLRRPRGIILVGMLLGDLFKHLDEVHVHAGCLLDEFLEFLEDGDELFGVLVCVFCHPAHVLSVHAVVCGKPCTRSESIELAVIEVIMK